MYRLLLSLSVMFILSTGMCLASVLPNKPVVPASEKVLPQHQHTSKCLLTSAEPVQIICILDRSGSMRHLTEDTVGGYNSFLAKQRQEKGKAEVTTILFDDQYEKITDAMDIKKVPDLTTKEYYARGTTALLDAIGRTVTNALGKMNQEGICPAKRRVLVLIMTDGKENNSREYQKKDVKSMIEMASKEYNWNFIFMGANIDSIAEANAIGIDADHAVNYDHTGRGVKKTFSRMNAAAKEMRETGTVGGTWKEAAE